MNAASAVWIAVIVLLLILLVGFLWFRLSRAKHHHHTHDGPCAPEVAAPAATIVSATSTPTKVEVATISAESPMAYYGQMPPMEYEYMPYHHHHHHFDDDPWSM